MPTLEDRVPEILRSLPTRISDVLIPWSQRSPDRPALVESSGTWTYRQLASVIAETRSWLVESGMRPGDRIMLVCENCRTLVAVLLAVAGLDAWPVLVNARLSARELDQIRDHCGARRVIYTTSVSPHARAHAERHGALIYDRNLLFVAAVAGRLRSLTPDDRLYGVLPMSHIVGVSVILLKALLNGATVYLSPRFDPAAALTALERDRLTVVLGVPAMYALLVEYAKCKGLTSVACPALRIISCSGAPLDPAIKSGVERLLGLPLYHSYGITETSPNIAQTRIEAPRRDTSVGPVFPGVEVKLVGLDGKPVIEGEVGELWARGPNVMKGYYKAPEETADAIDAEGWINTRDLARFENGNLFIVGRTKELIIRFGFNVYPPEIEAVLNAHPAVARSAVIGRPVKGDEEVIVFVQPVPDSPITAAELGEYAAKHLAPYKRPAHIFFVATLPTTATGKISKGELASTAAAMITRRST